MGEPAVGHPAAQAVTEALRRKVGLPQQEAACRALLGLKPTSAGLYTLVPPILQALPNCTAQGHPRDVRVVAAFVGAKILGELEAEAANIFKENVVLELVEGVVGAAITSTVPQLLAEASCWVMNTL